jgi:hypothetical protein
VSGKTQGDQVSIDQFFDDRTGRAKALYESLDETDRAWLHDEFMVPAITAEDKTTQKSLVDGFDVALTSLIAIRRKVSRREIQTELEG